MMQRGEWFDDIYQDLRLGVRAQEVLHQAQSRFQRIEVIDTASFGRVLVLDGVFQTSELDEHTYHEMLVQPAMVTAPRIAKVLVIGGGDGGTAREVLRHGGVEQLVMAEIDGDVVQVSKQYLPMIGTAWDDPRLDLRIEDGVAHVAAVDAGAYDVIILDGPDPIGPAKGLYAEAFYRQVERALSPDGVFALHAESPLLVRDTFFQVFQQLAQVFPKVRPYFGSVPLYGAGPWAWAFATRSVDPLALRDERLGTVEPLTRYYNAEIHRAAFAIPNELRRELAPVLGL